MNSKSKKKNPIAVPATLARPPASSLLDYYGILRRWKIVLLVVLLIVIGNTIRIVLQRSVYYSSAAVEVLPQQLNVGQQTYKEAFQYTSEMFFNTQMEFARTPEVLNLLIKKVGVDKTAQLLGMEPVSWKRSPESLYSEILRHTQTLQRRDTFILEMGIESSVPDGAAILSNSWAESLIEWNRQTSAKQSRSTSESISRQIERTQKSISDKESRLAAMSKSSPADQQVNVATAKMQGLTEQLNASQKEVLEKQANYNSLSHMSPSSIPQVLSSPSVVSLNQQCSQLEQQYQEQTKIFKPGWPALQQLKTRMDQTCGQRDQEMLAVFSTVLAASRAELDASRSKLASVQHDFDAAHKTINGATPETSEYLSLKTDLENERKLLDQLIQQRQSAELTDTGGMEGGVQMRIVDAAQVPSKPIRPRRVQSEAMGLIVGLIFGIGTAMFLNYIDAKVRSQQDIEQTTHFRFLTFVPDAEQEEEELIYNSFRFLWRHISAIDGMDKPPRVFIVTSAQPGEGKTFVTVNLAKALARMGKKTLLIDVDVHRPSVHETMGIRRQTGLNDFLYGHSSDFSIFPSPFPNLTVIPVDHTDRLQLAESLDSSVFIDSLTNAMGSFEYILMDSGPVLLTPETLAACVGVDGLILVVRNDYTTAKTLKLASELLQQVNVSVLGTVLNKVNLKDRFSNYHYYRQYYNYYKKPRMKEAEQTAEILVESLTEPRKRKKA
jgi:capsular exopolysaccharide synthesis family protein